MRSVTIAAAVLAVSAAGGAVAGEPGAEQRDGAVGSRPGATFDAPPPAPPATGRRSWRMQDWQRPAGDRASTAAPQRVRRVDPVAAHDGGEPAAAAAAGRSAYRRPVRGYALPPYWIGPRFVVTDFRAYGLTPPLPGYRWVRYYDDAVLIDARGSVFDARFDVDWARRGARERPDDRRVAAADVGDVHDQAVPDGSRAARHGDRHAADRAGARLAFRDDAPVAPAEDAWVAPDDEADGLPPPHRTRGRRYAIPVAPEYAPPPPPGYAAATGETEWHSPDGTTTVTTTIGDGHAVGGYGAPGAATTTVVIRTAPAVTTTTTEIYDEPVVSPGRRIVRRIVRRR